MQTDDFFRARIDAMINPSDPLAVLATRLDGRTSVSARPSFQLPTVSVTSRIPRTISVKRVRPRHMTMLPGGGSPLRAR